MIGIFVKDTLIAFRAMLVPIIDGEHLGIDAGLTIDLLPKVIYSEISNVDPDYRGNGLQSYMGKLLLENIDTQRFRYVCATVAPFNIPSIKDKFVLGLNIVALKEKYDGKLRYVLLKDLAGRKQNKTKQKTLGVKWIISRSNSSYCKLDSKVFLLNIQMVNGLLGIVRLDKFKKCLGILIIFLVPRHLLEISKIRKYTFP